MLQRRSDGLVIEQIDEETVVFDRSCDIAHTLDGDAARVWRACDGATDAATIARQLGLSQAVVEATTERLGALDLLEPDPTVSRRTALRRIALGASVAAVPLISSLVIPSAAAALSGGSQAQGTQGGGIYNF
jgi:hypothetical protein